VTGRGGNVSTPEHRGFAVRAWTACVAGVIALAALVGSSGDAPTQSAPPAGPLAATEPQPNALLATTPERISLTFTEPVDLPNASIRVLRAGGGEAPLGQIQEDDAFANRISARPLATLGLGDYIVVWSARTANDGEVLAGAYPFRTGAVVNPGATRLDGEWPALWAVIPRSLVFLGTSLAAGGFIWTRLLASNGGSSAPGSPVRGGTMAIGALAALLAAALLPFLNRLLSPPDGPLPPLAESLWAMPLGWWIQLVALFILALLCLGTLASGRATARVPVPIIWVGLGSGLAALVGLILTNHGLFLGAGRALALATSTPDTGAIPLAIAHQSSTALWLSGLLYLADNWRELGSDVARFRRVRWIGGVLLAVSILTGLAGTWGRFPSIGDLLSDRYGQMLAGKGLIVLLILLLGLVAMVLPRRLNVARTGRSLVTQGVLALVALLLAAVLALMALPGTVAPATLIGVELADVVPVDRAAFGMENATIHVLTQPVAPGAQTFVVRLTDGRGAALALDPAPDVDVTWTTLTAGAANDEPVIETALDNAPVRVQVQPDPSGALFAGTMTLPTMGWWQADVTVTPAHGVAARARFWLILPDPNVTGTGPEPTSDPEARALFARGLESLTSLRSVRYTQRLGDGSGALYRSQTAVNAADAERPPAYTDTILDDAGDVVARQVIVGDRRWILVGGDWVAAEPMPFFTPAEWGAAYVDATGFQLGPLEEVDGELSQVVTFWQPPRASPSRAPAWFSWWIGLASGEMRREVMVSTRHYMVYGYSDFDVPPGIAPPVDVTASAVSPATPVSTAMATPASTQPA
jgi:methionine-rich copper-binding protein CopC